MSNKNKEKIGFTSYDPVESPEEIIEKDKDIDRKEAFREWHYHQQKALGN